jgi:hypothetical protein
MKTVLRLLALVAVCSSLAIAATTTAAPAKKDAPAVDTSKFKTGGCCEKSEKGGKPCAHPCCVKVAKDGKVCEKCNPPAKDAPAPAKDAPATK